MSHPNLNFHPNYLKSALDNEYRFVASAKAGTRNDTLNRAAFKLAQLSIPENEIFECLVPAAQACCLVDEIGISAVYATIRSGMRAGGRNPRFPGSDRQHAVDHNVGVLTLDEATREPRSFPAATQRTRAFDVDGQFPNESRRHVYRQGDEPVHVKIKFRDGRWASWYRVENGWQPKKPAGYRPVPYIPAALNPFKPEWQGTPIYWPEGEKDSDTLARLNLPAFTFGGTSGLPKGAEQYAAGRHVVIPADNDTGGIRHAEEKAARCYGVAASVKIVGFAELKPPKKDVTDWFESGHGIDEFNRCVESAPLWRPISTTETGADFAKHAGEAESENSSYEKRSGGFEGFEGPQGTKDGWPRPKPLPDGLPPVDPFQSEFMADSLASWIDDIANRLQCPPDYVAVTAMTALGSVLGRRIGIRPQMKTDWTEIPNIWGAFIGRPGMLKSPAMNEALRPLRRLEADAAKENDIAQAAYEAGLNAYELRKGVKLSLEKSALKNNKHLKIEFDLGEEPKQPTLVRYFTNDASYEALGELLINNPTGILVERDELISLLQHLDREDQAVARGFYLSGWSGTQPYSFDRIGRGHKHVDAVCISVLGNTQPARICEYVKRANAGNAGGDGLIQRFTMVWPDAVPDWQNIDEYPDTKAREAAWEVFDRLSRLDEVAVKAIRAQKGPFDKVPFLRFEDEAHGDFLGWRTDLERRLRSGELSPALEGHLAKYRKLVPALALINHLADGGSGPVNQKATLKALAFADYLESHARRVYGASSEIERTAAKAILTRIRNGDLSNGFTARDIHQRDWSNLTDRKHVQAGLDLLVDLHYLAASTAATGERGGRPKVTYMINPRIPQ
jgi:putative DNA primase/helicase